MVMCPRSDTGRRPGRRPPVTCRSALGRSRGSTMSDSRSTGCSALWAKGARPSLVFGILVSGVLRMRPVVVESFSGRFRSRGVRSTRVGVRIPDAAVRPAKNASYLRRCPGGRCSAAPRSVLASSRRCRPGGNDGRPTPSAYSFAGCSSTKASKPAPSSTRSQGYTNIAPSDCFRTAGVAVTSEHPTLHPTTSGAPAPSFARSHRGAPPVPSRTGVKRRAVSGRADRLR